MKNKLNSKNKHTEYTRSSKSTETSSERPGWLPEKFSNAEELAKAYGELEKKMSSKPTEEKPVATKDLKIEPKEEVKSENALDAFYKEYADNGSLTEESI